MNRYQTVIAFPDISFCKIIGGMATTPFLQDLFDMMKTCGDVLEMCSRAGEFRASNISFSGLRFMSLWPAGDYKVNFVVSDDIDSLIVSGYYTATLQ